jgi:hypothetical protein
VNHYDMIVVSGGAPATTALMRWPKLACDFP